MVISLSKNRFLDGIGCSCGEIIDESKASYCGLCGDVCCDDCEIRCESCKILTCRNCRSVFQNNLCQNCESIDCEPQKKLDDVYIIVCGNVYKVSDKNGMATALLDSTDPTSPISQRTKYMDIRGLGILHYSFRSINNKGVGKGLNYYLYFNPCFDDLPY